MNTSYLRWGGAPKCEDYPCMDLARLRRRGKLRPGARCLITIGKEKPDRILVFTKADGTGLTFIKRRPDGALGKLFVSFTYSPTAFNGWRVWFCALRRADAIRRRLGGTAYGIAPQFPEKPKRMRWRTYSALKRKDAALRSHFLESEVDLVRALSHRLGRVRKSR